ncbi:MAG: hypothetical protein I3273_02965 [Candidatus Moeniiplasma glomeromycotorum]|nr:hypothetical protein [Candidatus Moeniiplasma glomeromycotorum]MCE8167581.1 hypothetical protein [Candidatus Moeniiplasma glomeromycotorum]MCE8169067.1 hypothetical protein [Candidatus Moeniiplasma glomeromycotorum]
MKQQTINLIKRVLNQTELESNQLTEKEWEKNIKEARKGDQEIIFCCQETLIDILNTTFKQDDLQVPQNLIDHLDLWRNCPSIPELVNKTIRSTKDLTELEKLANDLVIKQKYIVFISNVINKTMGVNAELNIYMDDLWMNFWQDEITEEKDSQKIIEHCQETLERIFKAVLSKVQLYNSFHTNQRIKTAQDFSQSENLVEEIMKEILEAKKKEYTGIVIHGGLWEGFKFSVLNEEEKQLINNTTDLNDLIDNIVPRIKEKQNEEARIRNEVIDNLQTEFDRLGLNIEEIDKNYIWTKVGDLLIPPEFSPWLADKSKNHLIFARKISSRLEDDLKTVEEVKKFEQEVKKHLQEKAKAKGTQQIETKVLYNLSKKIN